MCRREAGGDAFAKSQRGAIEIIVSRRCNTRGRDAGYGRSWLLSRAAASTWL